MRGLDNFPKNRRAQPLVWTGKLRPGPELRKGYHALLATGQQQILCKSDAETAGHAKILPEFFRQFADYFADPASLESEDKKAARHRAAFLFDPQEVIAMQLSPAGLDLIKRSEGFRPRAYPDAAGHLTIGYGHRLTPSESYPGGVSEAEAEVILLWDVREAAQAVERLVRVPLAQGQFDALVDFVFNLGSARLQNSHLLQLLNASRADEAAAELLRWDHCGPREIPGLKARRQAEFNLWHLPVDQAAAA